MRIVGERGGFGCGFSVVGEEGIEAGLKEADKKMYADKERAKGASV